MHHHPSRRPQAFSLVETTIAVGIAATVLVALVGLVPVSLETMREAGNTTAEARIVQSISADFRMRSWSEVTKLDADAAGVDFHFDSQGARVSKGDSGVIFTARVHVTDAEPLPGATGSNEGLRAVRIMVTNSPRPDAAFLKPERCRHAQTLVAQTDSAPPAPTVASK